MWWALDLGHVAERSMASNLHETYLQVGKKADPCSLPRLRADHQPDKTGFDWRMKPAVRVPERKGVRSALRPKGNSSVVGREGTSGQSLGCNRHLAID